MTPARGADRGVLPAGVAGASGLPAVVYRNPRLGVDLSLDARAALLTALLMDGPGAMIPPPVAAIRAAVVAPVGAGEVFRAVGLQRVFSTFAGPWMRLVGLTLVMKAAMRAVCLDMGAPCAPFESRGEGAAAAMTGELAAAGLVGGTPGAGTPAATAAGANLGAGPVAAGGGAGRWPSRSRR